MKERSHLLQSLAIFAALLAVAGFVIGASLVLAGILLGNLYTSLCGIAIFLFCWNFFKVVK